MHIYPAICDLINQDLRHEMRGDRPRHFRYAVTQRSRRAEGNWGVALGSKEVWRTCPPAQVPSSASQLLCVAPQADVPVQLNLITAVGDVPPR